MEPLLVGDPERVGPFTLRGRLGEGGMGQVFLGRSPGGHAVAVKLVHPHLARQAEFRSRFEREVAAARAVSGAFTAPVVGADAAGDPPWIATSYIPGPNLLEAIAAVGPLPRESVWPLVIGLVEALQNVHAAGLLHRDLKPSNVLLALDGPRLIDFGIARAMDATMLTRTGTVMGTPGFMSPEQAEGAQAGQPSDVFSLGTVVAFAAGGRLPFGEGPPLAILHRIVAGDPNLDGLDGPVRDLVASCLAKAPADRPTLAQLIERITAHWSPPEIFASASPWPEEIVTLIRNSTTSTVPAAHTPTKLLTTPLPPSSTETGTPQQGRNHADDFTATTSHAHHIKDTGNAGEAARLRAELAADQERVLGSDHPETLKSRYWHARHVGDAGDAGEAARLMAQVVAGRARALGPEHDDTLNARDWHARYVKDSGEAGEAARLIAQIAADQERMLGPDHDETRYFRFWHARYVGDAGDLGEAARLMAQVVADRARLLGPDDEATLDARDWHAWYVGQAGDAGEAARLRAELAADQERVRGSDHPETLKSWYWQARHVGDAGDAGEAARLMAQAAAGRARVLGPEHDDTLHTRDWHARYVKDSGEAEEAVRLIAEIAADQERMLGPDHDETRYFRFWHARYVGDAGDLREAARLMAQVVADRARLLGPDHEATLDARDWHAWYVGQDS